MDVKWIKVTTDMFDNRKIRYLRKLPEGNSIVLIWVMLLTLAGRCNAGGMIHLTADIPYTPKMLADELDFEENTVVLALKALEGLGMITSDPLEICNWEEYQNTEKMEKIREQTKKRMVEYRARKKALETGDGAQCAPLQEQGNADATRCYAVVTRNVTHDVTQCNATDIDIEEDIDTSLSERKKEKRKKADAEPCADTGDSVVAVFRSFLEKEYKALSPEERKAQEGWFKEVMEAFRGYAEAKVPVMDEKSARNVCGMMKRLFPKEEWVDFLRTAARREDEG